jgi:hypothetical protein
MGQLVADDTQQLKKKHNASKGRPCNTEKVTEHRNHLVTTKADTGTP